MERKWLQLIKFFALTLMGFSLTACVVVPQPIGYRMTSAVLPTYVNGHYVGMQPNPYATQSALNSSTVNSPVTAQSNQQAPIAQQNNYAQNVQQVTPAPTVAYVQAPQPVYTTYYNPYPYYAPVYNPWPISIGFGFNFHRGWGWHGRGRW